MRRIAILSCLIVLGITALGAPIDRQTAQTAATHFLQRKGLIKTTDQLTMYEGQPKDDEVQSLYIFNLDTVGFVIASADDRCLPILGYSMNGSFDYAKAPDNMKAWLSECIGSIQEGILANAPENKKYKKLWEELLQPTETTLTDPKSDSYLLTSTWEQGYGYNNYCPVMNGQHVVVGCVATAMAQIIRYYGKPTRGFGRKSYVHTAYGALAVDFDTTDYDYSLMPDHIRHSSPANQKDMVSRLCYHCGIVVNMEYQHAGHTSGSGAHTSNVPEGLTHFGYTDALHYTRSNINNDSLWVAMIHNEIDNRRPIEYSGFGDDGGHAFVLDGYNNQDQFHFNWGWGGYADGFYTLSTMAGFTSNHEMVINIYPSGWDGHLTRFLVSPDGEGDGTSWDEANRNINAAVQLNKLVNRDIWMKEGYYFGDTNNYYLYDFRYPATIIGGFAGTETSISQHDPKNHPTILEGRHNHGVLYAQAQAYGNRQLKIQDIIIQDGFSYDGDIVSIINNTIAKNITIRTSASINGNVLYAKDSRIIAADIYGNWGPTICLLSGAIMRQSLVYNNERLADNVEGTIILMQNDSRVVNCDIVSNHSTGVVFKHPRNSFVNNIVWNNEENLRFDTVLNDTAFRHCAIEGDSLVGDSTCILLNSSNDHAQGPRFVNPSIRRENAFASPDLDWHLDRGSICIDAGERLSESLADGDHDQSLRCRNKIVDIGCYESNYPVGIAPTEDRTAPSVHPNPASGTLTVSNCGQAGVQIFDITGRKVMESQAKGSTIRLDISQLPQGVYFLKSGESTLKVVKR